MIKKIVAVVMALTLSSSIAIATSTDHSQMNHGSMNHGKGDGAKMEQKLTMADGEGVVHSVSKLNRMVNLTHAPIPELNWPEMKMDLAVSKNVDLNALKEGDKVKFHIMLGDDNVFRLHQIKKIE